jgi:ornithine cyclodeaminase
VSLPYFDAAAVAAALPFDRTMRAIEEALRQDIDPEADGPRLFADAPDGEFLLMPAQSARFCGLKALTMAPNNPARGLEKIQGVYVLYSSDTLAPVAIMEGSSLTAIRTPAVAISAVRQLAALAAPGDELPESPRVLVFGVGTQGRSSILAMQAAFPAARFEVVGRRPERVEALRSDLATLGIEVAHREDVDAAVSEADVIVTATTSSTPLFDGSLVQPNAIVAAIGTHGYDAREVDDVLVARADIVVEGRASAQRENGNLHTYFTEADWRERPPSSVRDLARGEVSRRAGHPALYTGVGMSWEDLVCATVVFEEGTPSH